MYKRCIYMPAAHPNPGDRQETDRRQTGKQPRDSPSRRFASHLNMAHIRQSRPYQAVMTHITQSRSNASSSAPMPRDLPSSRSDSQPLKGPLRALVCLGKASYDMELASERPFTIRGLPRKGPIRALFPRQVAGGVTEREALPTIRDAERPLTLCGLPRKGPLHYVACLGKAPYTMWRCASGGGRRDGKRSSPDRGGHPPRGP